MLLSNIEPEPRTEVLYVFAVGSGRDIQVWDGEDVFTLLAHEANHGILADECYQISYNPKTWTVIEVRLLSDESQKASMVDSFNRWMP